MRLDSIVLKDLLRRKSKLAIAILGVVVAAAAIVAVVTTFSAASDSLYEESTKFGANIIVRPQVTDVPLVVGSTSIGSLSTGENYIPESDVPKIYTIQNSGNLAVVAPRLYGVAEISNSSVVVMGVSVEDEKELKPWWNIEGEWISDTGSGSEQVMVGSDIAVPLGLEPGSSITLTSGNRTMDANVVGVIESTGGTEDSQIILPLATAQYLLDKEGKVSSLEVRALCNSCPVPEMSRQIEGVLPGLEARAMSQIVESEMAVIGHMQSSAMAVSIITLLVSALTTASTMIASVNEKIKEIGIMRAIGANDIQIVRMLFLEGLVIGVVGGTIGFALGTAVSYVAAPIIVSATASPIWILLPAVVGVSVVVGMVASIIPAKRALSIDPAEVLRSV
ncbi:putative ABC transport system permease protein [Methanohalophilus levihalophilus]|uniref:ABC transporter permease n=1 Tax=Methanohalophilus levihalophilus TaxID=1431282 RepID=UPI001AE9BB24|nr:FtsX-like permease family protein [Methanohalophilus levihalophilus]MBP2031272.1 putative ABC transport system permease protein [Methanohalophilus levihalophilus]